MHNLNALKVTSAVIALGITFSTINKASASDDLPGFSPSPYPLADVMIDSSKPVVVYTQKAGAGDFETQSVTSSQAARLLAKARQAGRIRIIVGIDFAEPSPGAGAAEMSNHAKGLRTAQDAVLQRVGLLVGGDATTAAADAGVKRFDTTAGFAVEATPDLLQRLLADPGVVSIEEDMLLAPNLSVSVPLIGGTALRTMGLTGKGYSIAVIDSGTDTKFDRATNTLIHPMLKAKVKAVGCYSTNSISARTSSLCPGGVPESIGTFAGANCPLNIPGCDHGTHVAGIALGDMKSLKGVATGANLISIQVFTKHNNPLDCKGTTTPCIRALNSDIVKALDRARALQAQYKVVAVNLSLGGGSFGAACDSVAPVVTAAFNNVRAAGIAPIVSSGNDSSNGSISFPACISTAIAVGSTTKFAPETVSTFSNHSEQVRLLAPGTGIVSAKANGKGQPQTVAKSGTSMAAPHVAGAFALLKQAKPSASIDDILNALECTGKPITRLGVPKPRINLVAARDFLVAGKPCSFDIVVLDSGNLKDDIFVIKVDGTEICRTPVGGRRECGIKGVGKGTHQLSVFVELAPDDIGTYTVTLGNTVKFSDGSSSKTGAPPEGATDNFTIIVQ